MKNALVTGSGGLIGSQAAIFFAELGYNVVGIDNNMRKYFFGNDGDVSWNITRLKVHGNYSHIDADIRSIDSLENIFKHAPFDVIIHCAAQPSHDWAAKEPLTDFSVNAVGTLNLLEMTRKYCPQAVFIFTSTNKVYGDTPNFAYKYDEKELRWELPEGHSDWEGIAENMSIDNSKHSVFGASKVAADVMVQEYGKYFGMNTAVFRGGCLTGPAHSAAELHGFLAYLIKCIYTGKQYTIFGYKGKQVRDNIHSSDLVNAFYEVVKSPVQGEVFNIGGSRHSNISMLEAIRKIELLLDKKANIVYSEKAREGDHIWYVSDVSKFKKFYPNWKYEYDIDRILAEMCEAVKRS